MTILKLLDESSSVKKYIISDLRIFENGFYIKITATLIDNSVLNLKEYSDNIKRNYSYQWQKSTGELIIRWDNAPHFKIIPTFLHHYHKDNNVYPNTKITLNEILMIIEDRIKEKKGL